MNNARIGAALLMATLWLGGCARLLADNPSREANQTMPGSYGEVGDSAASLAVSQAAQEQWDTYFADPDLATLIEEALKNNQELNIQVQEVIIAKNEVPARRGEYLPTLRAIAGAGIEKVGAHTSQGVSDEAHGVPEHLPNFTFGFVGSWEIDVWGKLRNAAKSANYRYLASVEAKNFLITEIVAEIARSYYELVALDSALEILGRNLAIQRDALELVRLKKEAARATELAVQRFQAEVLKNTARIYELKQRQVEVENRINFLVGRMPQPVGRNPARFNATPAAVSAGVPTQLLENRPDIRRAELELEAAKLDVKVARARFFPSLSIEAGIGYESFNIKHLVSTPQSLLYNLAGNLVAPLLNRAAITAEYRSANATQIQAVFNYERSLIQAFTEVVNQLAMIQNLAQVNARLTEQVQTLHEAVEVSSVLYQSARADYLDVLLTRRELLDAELELLETKKTQMQARVGIYQALGGGWREH